MAIIKCPECNSEVSDKTKTCPHCGYPIKCLRNIFKPDTPLDKKTIIALLVFILFANIILAIYIYNIRIPSDISNHDYQIAIKIINVFELMSIKWTPKVRLYAAPAAASYTALGVI